ncbi:hypothetical protein FQN57_003671 [Myotisia sp. PD_48]|nr:hypothetical protein FQN57_003671 [Myotisia sp. PD_48]
MSSFHYNGEELSHKLIATTAQLLDDAGIPNLLWGDYPLVLMGVPAVPDGGAFVVADEHLSTSYSTLLDAGFHACNETFDCQLPTGLRGPAPAAHLHLEDGNPANPISLHRKSEILSMFPTFELAFSDPKTWDIIISSEICPTLYPFRFLSASKFVESTVILISHNWENRCAPWLMGRLSYVMQYLEETEYFKAEDVHPLCIQFYTALKTGDPKTGLMSLDKIKAINDPELFSVELISETQPKSRCEIW